MARFRKREIEVEAIQWEGGDYSGLDEFCGHNWGRADSKDVITGNNDGEDVVVWNTLSKQWLSVPTWHWIIRGTRGELYPCHPDVFQETYRSV